MQLPGSLRVYMYLQKIAETQKPIGQCNFMQGWLREITETENDRTLQLKIWTFSPHISERRFNFGATYGNTTRSLDVCAHKQRCFGEFNNAAQSTA